MPAVRSYRHRPGGFPLLKSNAGVYACLFSEDTMKLASCCLLFAIFSCGAAYAQKSKNPVSDVAREILASRQKSLIDAVDEMPTDKFSYKPTPQQMTFG